MRSVGIRWDGRCTECQPERVNLFAFLLGTVGGFGAVFSFVIRPQLRGLNRISVYIAFFSIAAVRLRYACSSMG